MPSAVRGVEGECYLETRPSRNAVTQTMRVFRGGSRKTNHTQKTPVRMPRHCHQRACWQHGVMLKPRCVSLLVWLLPMFASCNSMRFGSSVDTWHDHAIWPGQTHALLVHEGGTADLVLGNSGPGGLLVTIGNGAAQHLGAGDELKRSIVGPATVRLACSEPKAATIQARVAAQNDHPARLLDITGQARADARGDFEAQLTLQPRERLQVVLDGENAVLHVRGSGRARAAIKVTTEPELGEDRRLAGEGWTTIRGAATVGIEAANGVAVSLDLTVRDAQSFAVKRVGQ